MERERQGDMGMYTVKQLHWRLRIRRRADFIRAVKRLWARVAGLKVSDNADELAVHRLSYEEVRMMFVNVSY